MEKAPKTNYEAPSDSVETDILESEAAQDILPYLTLDLLDDRNKEDILLFADEVLEKMDRGEFKKVHALMGVIDDAVAELSGEEDSWGDGRVTPKLAQARKLFAASILHSANSDTVSKYYDTFFEYTPSIMDYTGGLRGKLELLSVSNRESNNPCSTAIIDSIMYNDSGNELTRIFNESGVMKQMELLPIFTMVACRCDRFDESSPTLRDVLGLFRSIKESKDAKPLIKILASEAYDGIQYTIDADWEMIEEGTPEWNDMKNKEATWKKEQDTLKQEFPVLSDEGKMIRIAPGVAGILSYGTVTKLADRSGNSTSLLNYSRDNAFGLDRDMASLIGAAHNPGVKELIDEKLGINLETIPFEAQKHLLKFMTEADDERFTRLCGTLHGVDEKLRVKLAENFVAAEFGEDFGDSLLSIAKSERLSDGEKEKFLDAISSCRASVGQITGLYMGVDGGDFAKEYTRAANERLTDLVAAFSEIAKSGRAEADLDWAGRTNFDYNSAAEALEYERKSLEIIAGTFGDVIDGKEGAFAEIVSRADPNDQRHNRTLYSLFSPEHGYVLLQTRAEGAETFDPMIEYGRSVSRYNGEAKNVGTEATISMVTNPVDPFSLPNPFRPDRRAVKNPNFYDSPTMDKVSAIRLDREGRSRYMQANDPNRSPVNAAGSVSVDLSAIGDRADTPSGKIARLISTGNAIRSNGGDISLNHNTNWFDQDKYGSVDGFANLVHYLDRQMTRLTQGRPPRKDEGFTGAMRTLSRRRGNTAARSLGEPYGVA